jgi:hypothetical protein
MKISGFRQSLHRADLESNSSKNVPLLREKPGKFDVSDNPIHTSVGNSGSIIRPRLKEILGKKISHFKSVSLPSIRSLLLRSTVSGPLHTIGFIAATLNPQKGFQKSSKGYDKIDGHEAAGKHFFKLNTEKTT